MGSREALKQAIWDEIWEDPSNTLLGISLLQLRRIVQEYQERGINPYELAQARQELATANKRLSDIHESIARTGMMLMEMGKSDQQPWPVCGGCGRNLRRITGMVTGTVRHFCPNRDCLSNHPELYTDERPTLNLDPGQPGD